MTDLTKKQIKFLEDILHDEIEKYFFSNVLCEGTEDNKQCKINNEKIEIAKSILKSMKIK